MQPDRRDHLRERHQLHAQPDHDAEVGLHEQLIEHRAEAPLVDMPAGVVGHGSHAGSKQLPVGEHDLHSAGGRELGAVGHVGEAVLERVAYDAAPAQIWDRRHQPMAAVTQRRAEIEPLHARLDHGVAELLVDLEDAVHPAQVHHHRALHSRRAAAVAVVAALRGARTGRGTRVPPPRSTRGPHPRQRGTHPARSRFERSTNLRIRDLRSPGLLSVAEVRRQSARSCATGWC